MESQVNSSFPADSHTAILNKTRAGVYEILPQHMLVPKDNLKTRLLYYTKYQSRKREIIQSNINRILLIVNQVICTLDIICELNIMNPAQAVLKIFCSQGPLCLCLCLKREIVQSNFDRNFMKSHQMIYIMYPNCMLYDPSSSGSPDILFTRLLFHTKRQTEKGSNSVKYLQNFAKS